MEPLNLELVSTVLIGIGLSAECGLLIILALMVSWLLRRGADRRPPSPTS